MASLQSCDYHENVLKNGREHPRQRGLSTQSFLVNERVRPFHSQFWQLHLSLVIHREREGERERERYFVGTEEEKETLQRRRRRSTNKRWEDVWPLSSWVFRELASLPLENSLLPHCAALSMMQIPIILRRIKRR